MFKREALAMLLFFVGMVVLNLLKARWSCLGCSGRSTEPETLLVALEQIPLGATSKLRANGAVMVAARSVANHLFAPSGRGVGASPLADAVGDDIKAQAVRNIFLISG